jgi:acyl-[acyl carrier protein]--UDP-N-acetylglucosamine O-acyltransferase
MPIYKGFIPLQDPYPYKYMTARKTAVLGLPIDGLKRRYLARIMIESLSVLGNGPSQVTVKGIFKKSKNGRPRREVTSSQAPKFSGDQSFIALFDYSHPKKSWLEV